MTWVGFQKTESGMIMGMIMGMGRGSARKRKTCHDSPLPGAQRTSLELKFKFNLTPTLKFKTSLNSTSRMAKILRTRRVVIWRSELIEGIARVWRIDQF